MIISFLYSPLCEKCAKQATKKCLGPTSNKMTNVLMTRNIHPLLVPTISQNIIITRWVISCSLIKLCMQDLTFCNVITYFSFTVTMCTVFFRWYMSIKIPRNINHIPNPKRLYVFGGVMGTRHLTGIVRLAGRLLKVRYLLFGSAVGGGMAASKVVWTFPSVYRI